MSHPHPEGAGAIRAMRQALNRAGLQPADIDYINLHGTATRANDTVEDKAVHEVFGSQTAASSTKGWTGHALGAAGITEALISAICLTQGFVPGTLNCQRVDSALSSHICARTSLVRFAASSAIFSVLAATIAVLSSEYCDAGRYRRRRPSERRP